MNNSVDIFLRDATEADLVLLMAWRSNPLIYRYSFQQKAPLSWEEHYRWWQGLSDTRVFIIKMDNGIVTRDIGVIVIGHLDSSCPEISIYVGEITLWGKGIGHQALSLALDWIQRIGYVKTCSKISKTNKRSLSLFKSFGFRQVNNTQEIEQTYQLLLKERR